MPNKNYVNGIAKERKLMDEYRAKGYKVMRSAGSHGLIDVIAWNKKEVLMFQVKNGKNAYNDDDIGELIEMPRPAGVRVFLAERERGGWNMIEC